jgi:hypothetical protein
MITKIFQGTKKIVEEQLAAYTSSLSKIHSISLTTTVINGLEENLPRVIYLTVIVIHEENAVFTSLCDVASRNKSEEVISIRKCYTKHFE